MKKLCTLFLFFFFVHTTLFCQPGLNPGGGSSKETMRVNNAILKFKQTDFMLKFGDFKFHMETSAKNFIAQQNKYTPTDARKVQFAYEKTAARFNLMLLSVKEDFLDKKKVEMINQFPDMYSDGLASKMTELEKFHKANFQQTLNDVTQTEGVGLILALIELIKSASDLSGFFKGMKYDKLAMSDEYIKKNLVDPYTFATWTELVTNTPKVDTGGNNNGGVINNGGVNNGGVNTGNTGDGSNSGNTGNTGDGSNSGNTGNTGDGSNNGGVINTGKGVKHGTVHRDSSLDQNGNRNFGVEGPSTNEPEKNNQLKKRGAVLKPKN